MTVNDEKERLALIYFTESFGDFRALKCFENRLKYKTNFRCFLSVSEAYCLGHLNLSNRGISEVKRIIIGKGEIRILNKMNFCPTLLFLRQSG